MAESEFDAQFVAVCAGGSGGAVESGQSGHGHAGGVLGGLYSDSEVPEERQPIRLGMKV
jgi:hypothetical protein